MLYFTSNFTSAKPAKAHQKHPDLERKLQFLKKLSERDTNLFTIQEVKLKKVSTAGEQL